MATDKKFPALPERACFDCCNDIRDVVACICSLDKECECVEGALGHCYNLTKSKVMTCVILRKFAQLDAKLDLIIDALNAK